jgi:hypothetical protein
MNHFYILKFCLIDFNSYIVVLNKKNYDVCKLHQNIDRLKYGQNKWKLKIVFIMGTKKIQIYKIS